MTKANDLRALHALFNALVDQRITTKQFTSLQTTLRSSADARQVYLDFIDLHFSLRKLERMEGSIDPIDDAMRRFVGEQDGSMVAQHTLDAASTGVRLRDPRTWRILTAVALFSVAAALMIAVSTTLLRAKAVGLPAKSIVKSDTESTATPPSSQVLLTQSVRASFFGELAPSLDSAMQMNHEYALTTGIIELHFSEGATAILEAPAVFMIVSASRLVLQSGQCSVYAPDGAEGFQVDTPLTNIVDLGTRFSVAVDETGETDVQVLEGLAEVVTHGGISSAQEKPIRLTDRQRRVYSGSPDVISLSTVYDDSKYRSQLPDRVVSYQATNPNGRGAVELVSVTVQRGGNVYTYEVDSLIGIELTHFKSVLGKNANPVAYSFENPYPELAEIIADRALNTGIINPGGSVEPLQTNPVMASPEATDDPNTPGMAIRFRQPIINAAGPDVLVFDLQTFTNPPFGDAFHISPVAFEPGLRTHTVRMFDITLNSKEAKELENFGLMRAAHPINSLAELQGFKAMQSRVHTHFRALAVGVDLSDLGIAIGATVEQLFIQDAMDDNDSFVDPALIVGLPAARHADNQHAANTLD